MGLSALRAAIVLALAGLLLAGCASAPTEPVPPTATAASGVVDATCAAPVLGGPDATWRADKPRVRLNTSLGEFVVELDTEAAPITAANFLNLSRNGVYDGTLFHRVIKDFVIQGGDPLSKDADPANDGSGGPGYTIPDEFNPTLRHEGEGVLSMANAGPNTGGSQFFVTLARSPHLDDRHSVFGRVVEGIEVVRAIGTVQVDTNDRPVQEVRIVKAELLDAARGETHPGALLHATIGSKKAEPGRDARFAIVLQNTGNTRDRMALGAAPPAGWTCALEGPVEVLPGSGRVVLLALKPPAGGVGTTRVPLLLASATGASANASVEVTIAPLGPSVKQGDKVTANYAGLLPDGRLFDTSLANVAHDEAQPKFATLGGFQVRPSYSAFPFTVGVNVIEGFTTLAKTARVGETVVGRIPQEQAYEYVPGQSNVYEDPLTGRDLIFELEILKVG
ncbi:MAG TPA: peptidylprolyl isomerase [Candidatus Thermoplasmatota archaeon]|nr:peptidylprolyl isomerase [Candidatus Thermoplasmatota archaeon]